MRQTDRRQTDRRASSLNAHTLWSGALAKPKKGTEAFFSLALCEGNLVTGVLRGVLLANRLALF